jgi:hypothetical protein
MRVKSELLGLGMLIGMGGVSRYGDVAGRDAQMANCGIIKQGRMHRHFGARHFSSNPRSGADHQEARGQSIRVWYNDTTR